MKQFHLYGRKEYPRPLTFIQTVEAASEQEMEEKVKSLTRDPQWIEMVAIPEEAIITLIPGDETS